MIQDIYIFHSAQEISGLFDTFFGGLFQIKGIPILLQVSNYLFFASLVALAYYAIQTQKKIHIRWVQGLSFLFFFLLCFFFFSPWDELFVNLRHSQHLRDLNLFSFNKNSRIEGTVDFLPYFVIGLLGKFGIPLVELSFLFSIGGGLLCIRAAIKILQKWQIPSANIWAPVVFLIYAPLVLNSGTGFTATIFTASILWSLYFLFYSKEENLGIAITSLVPLIRTEGVWLLFLFFLVVAVKTKKIPVPKLILFFVPIALLTVGRYLYFGHLFPTPITFKASPTSLFYLAYGIRNLFADLVASGTFLCLLVAALSFPNWKKEKTYFAEADRILLGLLFIYILPYYSSGGDWFPSAWGRYMLPFSIFSFLIGIKLFYFVFVHNKTYPVYILFTVLFLGYCSISFSSHRRFFPGATGPQKMLMPTPIGAAIPMAYRTHYLSQLGEHLHQVTEPTDKIASSEVATVMYYADREILDFLGVANPEIAHRPLRQTPPLFRKSPKKYELPFLIFKRLYPDLLEMEKPEILYTFDFFVERLLPNTFLKEVHEKQLYTALRRWERNFEDMIKTLYGGLDRILKLGYQPIIIHYANDYWNLYFVSSQALERHLASLRANGFEGGKYKVENVDIPSLSKQSSS